MPGRRRPLLLATIRTSHNWTWDNTDIRYADSTSLGNIPITYGITANNGPTVQDPWNTTPAWGFPYAASTVAPTPAAGTIIDGAFAAHVGSVGAYAYIDDALYLEVSAYRTLDPNMQNDSRHRSVWRAGTVRLCALLARGL